ncbi:MAG: hypothetical protein IT495_13995 [Gammaproteobacteria bacterium]|nr:hypothetical protein [Gammaproteobacteria bacterium]
MIRRRTARALSWWLLPWLLARLLVPAGVMPAGPGGEPGWVLCSGISLPGAAPGEGAGDGGDGQRAGGACPYALAGTSAPPPAAGLVSGYAAVGTSQRFPAESGPAWPAARSHAHRARGPPQYS